MPKEPSREAYQAEAEIKIYLGREEPTKLLKKLSDGLLNKNSTRFNQ